MQTGPGPDGARRRSSRAAGSSSEPLSLDALRLFRSCQQWTAAFSAGLARQPVTSAEANGLISCVSGEASLMLPGRPAVPRSGCAGSFLRRATSFYLLKLRCRHEATTSYDRRVFERHTHAQAAASLSRLVLVSCRAGGVTSRRHRSPPPIVCHCAALPVRLLCETCNFGACVG